jgi:hypothetical protein
MIITVSVPNRDQLSQEDIDEKLCLLEVKYGGDWRYSKLQFSFIGELNLREFLKDRGLTLVIP